jgi:RNA polymerase sigma-70 factor (ECF subfamily)
MPRASTGDLAVLRPRLQAYAQRRLRDRALAEDAVQETLLAALEGLDGYAGESSLSTWVFGILKHKMVDGLRRRPREESLEGELRNAADEGPGPEQSCASRSALALLERSLERLPEKAARAFVLREVLGLSTEEACRALSVTPTHCWVLVHRARTQLRACPELGRLAAEAGA